MILEAPRVAVLGFLVASCGDSQRAPCSAVMRANEPAIFNLSCSPTDLTGVSLSGPCSVGDASPSHYLIGPGSKSLGIVSPSPGRCHVVLTFATGFTYSADVTFTSQDDTVTPGCPASHTAPTQQTFAVNNPSGTCVAKDADARAP